MTNYETRLRLSLTTSEARAIKLSQKMVEKLEVKSRNHRLKADNLDAEITKFRHRIDEIKRDALKRYEKKCPHTNIRGPYSCARDDCSGRHYSCTDCGTSEFPKK